MDKLTNPSMFLYEAGAAKINDTPYPEILDPHDVILRIAYVGVCGSDVCLLPSLLPTTNIL
jgi:D-xylulose reductase